MDLDINDMRPSQLALMLKTIQHSDKNFGTKEIKRLKESIMEIDREWEKRHG